MSYGISYASLKTKKTYTSSNNPYDDWITRDRNLDTIFQYKDHCHDVVDSTAYFLPGCKFGYIEHYAEFVVIHFKVWMELSFDETNKIVHVERLFCERENYWSDASRNDIKSGSGGIGYYKKNLENLNVDYIGLDAYVLRFFGPEWNAAPLPITRPRPSKNTIDLVNNCKAAYFDYNGGPWFRVVGVFPMERTSAATSIQKYFRGWRVKMKYRHNPNTTLGRYTCMRLFQNALDSPR